MDEHTVANPVFLSFSFLSITSNYTTAPCKEGYIIQMKLKKTSFMSQNCKYLIFNSNRAARTPDDTAFEEMPWSSVDFAVISSAHTLYQDMPSLG